MATSMDKNGMASCSQTSTEAVLVENGTSTRTENRRNRSFTEYPKISEIFVGKTVLVTGATGFLGKVLVEKLLRSCPDIKELLVLIRPSKKGSVEARFDDYKRHHIFERLREEGSEALYKLHAVTGDIVQDNAGIPAVQLQKVINEVSFVFNCAANVRFEDDAREILNINLVGVQNVLDLCKECKVLEALVHVSTAYAFCNNPVIAEQLYPESVNPHQLVDLTKFMNERDDGNTELKSICMKHLQGRPSLYPFSKAMAETLLVQSKQTVPVAIVRPSIVTASVEEPYPGWIDNFNGPSGFIHVCGKGIVKTLLVAPETNADWVPVDTVANTLIAAAHYLVIKRKFINPPMQLEATNGVSILNCTCPEQNSITWMEIVDLILPALWQYPSMDVCTKPGGTVTSCPVIYFMCRLTYHYLPAVLLDLISLLLLRKPRMISLYRRIHGVMSHLEYYTTRPFRFNCHNMRKLVYHMDPADRRVFPIDQSILNWPQYMDNYVLGVRRYFSREPDDTIPEARKRMMRFYYFWMMLKVSSVCGMLMFMKFLFKRGGFKVPLVASFSVMATSFRR